MAQLLVMFITLLIGVGIGMIVGLFVVLANLHRWWRLVPREDIHE